MSGVVDLGDRIRRAEQQAVARLGAHHLQEQGGGALRIVEGERPAGNLRSKVRGQGGLETRLATAAQFGHQFGKSLRFGGGDAT